MDNINKRDKYEIAIKKLRKSVLLVTIFSAIDLLLCAVKPLTSFPLTAFCPHLLMTSTYRMRDNETGLLGFYIGVFMAAIIVFAYLILFLMMRKKQRRTISALIFYTIDTIIMIYGVFFMFRKSPFSPFIFDIAFHIWMMVTAIKGTVAFFKLRKLNKETPVEAKEAE